MAEMSWGKRKMKRALMWMAVGSAITIAAIISIDRFIHRGDIRDPKPYISPISGAPAKVAEPRRDGDVIQYPLSYDDKGESILNVPVDSIAEARAWRHDVWSTTALYLSDGTVGVLKGYRYGRSQIAVGPWIRIPRLESRIHYKARADTDAGICVAFTLYSDSPLF